MDALLAVGVALDRRGQILVHAGGPNQSGTVEGLDAGEDVPRGVRSGEADDLDTGPVGVAPPIQIEPSGGTVALAHRPGALNQQLVLRHQAVPDPAAGLRSPVERTRSPEQDGRRLEQVGVEQALHVLPDDRLRHGIGHLQPPGVLGMVAGKERGGSYQAALLAAVHQLSGLGGDRDGPGDGRRQCGE